MPRNSTKPKKKLKTHRGAAKRFKFTATGKIVRAHSGKRPDRYAFRDRRVKKREYRKLWIQRIGAAARLNGLTYGQLIHGLKAAGVSLDRKVLGDMAVLDAGAFAQLSQHAKSAAPPPKKKTA